MRGSGARTNCGLRPSPAPWLSAAPPTSVASGAAGQPTVPVVTPRSPQHQDLSLGTAPALQVVGTTGLSTTAPSLPSPAAAVTMTTAAVAGTMPSLARSAMAGHIPSPASSSNVVALGAPLPTGALPCPSPAATATQQLAVNRHGSSAAIHSKQRKESVPLAPVSPSRPMPHASFDIGNGCRKAPSVTSGPSPMGVLPTPQLQNGGASSSASQEQERVRGLELQIRELRACVERLGHQAEAELEKTAAAQHRADAAEEQRARFTEELERERQRAQTLEESYGGLKCAVELLTRQAQEAGLARGEASAVVCGGTTSGDGNCQALAARVRELEHQVEVLTAQEAAAEQRYQEKAAECADIRRELVAACAERAELDVLQAEHNGKVEQYLSRVMQENDWRAEAITEREARIEELDDERTSWMVRYRTFEAQVATLKDENQALHARIEALEREKDWPKVPASNNEGHGVPRSLAEMPWPSPQATKADNPAVLNGQGPVVVAPLIVAAPMATAAARPDVLAGRDGSSSVSMAQWMQNADAVRGHRPVA
mmetsp:Transcript_48506/g.135566  ORF Transcript_48506/g.135566 Transcript_48506/m.135566 type:complete len:543 (-) Transcript_48506:108-1736(-)